MKFDILHNFISPVTGHILSDQNYVPYGNRKGIAVPSPIIIDIRLDLINLRKRYNTLVNTDFIVGHGNTELTNAQVLDDLNNGFVYNNNGIINTFPAVPHLPLCYAATTVNLLFSYLNGDNGIGATLTATSLGAFTVDGVNPPLNSNILVKDQTTTFQNGLYVLTTVGGLLTEAILTRSVVYDMSGEIQSGDLVAVQYGTDNGQTIWVETEDVTEIGIDPILFTPFTLFNTLPKDNIWIGNTFNEPIPHPIILFKNLPDLTEKLIWRGTTDNRPYESEDLITAEKNITKLSADLKDLLTDLKNITAIANNALSIAEKLDSLLAGTVGGLSYIGLLALAALLQLEVTSQGGDIKRLKESLGRFYQQALVPLRPENSLVDVIDDLIASLNSVGDRLLNLTVNQLPIVFDVDFKKFKIINLANPTNPQDGVTKYYVDLLNVEGTPGQINSSVSLITEFGPHNFLLSLAPTGVTHGTYTYTTITVDDYGRITAIVDGDNTITLIGPVTGAGILGSPITTTFHLRLNEISTLNATNGNIDLHNFKIVNLADPTDALDAVNLETLQSYIPTFFNITLTGDVTGTGPSNLPIVTTLTLNLNQISTQNLTMGNVNLNTFKLVNVKDPTSGQDAATKTYVDLINVLGTSGEIISTPSLVTPSGPYEFTVSLDTTGVTAGNYIYTALTVDIFGRITAAASGDNTITLIGPVTGAGILGSPITTTFHLRLNEISTLNATNGNIDLHNFKIVNLADPSGPLDGVNLQTLQSYIPVEFTINLVGDVIGSGPSNLPIITTMVKTLNNIDNAGNINIKNFQIYNLTDPINPLDAVNLRTLNYYIAGLHLDGFVVGGPPIGGVIVTNRGPRCLLTYIPAGGNVNFDNFRITNLSDSESQYDGVNYNTLWELINDDLFYAKYITPELKVLGPLQQFKFDINYSGFQLSNSFIPTILINSNTKLEFSNSEYSGYRIRQETATGSTSGNLYFEQYVNANYDGDKYFGMDEVLQETVFYKDASMDNHSLRDVADMPEVLDDASVNNAISFAFLFKLLNDEVI